jgi:hypothetical protein
MPFDVAAAMPPDVRKGFALPKQVAKEIGATPHYQKGVALN